MYNSNNNFKNNRLTAKYIVMISLALSFMIPCFNTINNIVHSPTIINIENGGILIADKKAFYIGNIEDSNIVENLFNQLKFSRASELKIYVPKLTFNSQNNIIRLVSKFPVSTIVFSGMENFGTSSKSFFEVLNRYDISNFFTMSFADEYYKNINKNLNSVDSKEYFNYLIRQFDSIENINRSEK